MGNGLEPRGNLLVGLTEKFNQFADDVLVATVEECGGQTGVPSTSGTTNTMNIVVDIAGEVVVDNVGDVGDIQTTSGNGGGDHDGGLAGPESVESVFSLALSAITVDRSGRQVVAVKEVTEHISHALGLDEDKCQSKRILILTGKDIEKDTALVMVFNILNLLGDVLGSGADTSNTEEDVVLQEVASEHLDIAGESGREHEGLACGGAWHVFALDDTTNLGFETHIQHAISLIENEVLDIGERDSSTLDEIDETTGSSGEKITSFLDLAELLVDVGTTIDDSRADPGAVRELASLLVDLRDQLTRGREDQGSREGLARATAVAVGIGRLGNRGRAIGERG